MDRRAIGVFDSGLGGLSSLRVLEKEMPYENIIYFGDTANMPYGPRSRDEIVRLAVHNAEVLLKYDVKAILVACGTVSCNALDVLRERFPVPFFGVIEAASSAAEKATKSGRVGVIATQASIKSGAYRRELEKLNDTLEITEQACPSFVPLVESGHFSADDPLVIRALDRELAPVREANVDTLILGCTHYPMLEEAVSGFMGPDVRLVSSGAEAAYALVEHIRREGMQSGEREGKSLFFTSGDIKSFSESAKIFLGHGVCAERAGE